MRIIAAVLFLCLTAVRVLHAQPQASISSTTLDFKTVVLLDSKILTLTIKNTGNQPLIFSNWTGPWTNEFLVGGQFKYTLDPDSSETLTVKFTPLAPTASHVHIDSLHLVFPNLADSVTIILTGIDHVPMQDTVVIADSFIAMPNQIVLIPQYLTFPLTAALDSINSFSEIITWDPKVLDIKAWDPGALIQGWSIIHSTTAPGQAIIRANAGGHAIAGNGELMRFQFQVLPNAKVISVSPFIQESLVFGAGFEPVMSSVPGKITVIDSCTTRTNTGDGSSTMILPSSPNPFHNETTISYEAGGTASVHASIRVYDSRGELVASPLDDVIEPGVHHLTLYRKNLSPGVYSVVYNVGSIRDIRKIVVAP